MPTGNSIGFSYVAMSCSLSKSKIVTSAQLPIAIVPRFARRMRVAGQPVIFLIASGSVVVVIAIVLAFVLVKVNSHGSSGSSASGNGPTGTALATVVKNTTTVPASTLNSVGAGSVSTVPAKISGGSALTSGGKPEML